jgi:hypothetical protein
MNDDFKRMHRQLGRAIVTLLKFAALFLLLAVGAALFGLPNAVESLKSVAWSCVYVAAVLGSIYVLAHAFVAFVQAGRWVQDRRADRLR